MSFLRRLRVQHVAPPLFLALCLCSMVVLAKKLGAEIHAEDVRAKMQMQMQQQDTATGTATMDTQNALPLAAAADDAPMLSLPHSFEDARLLSLRLSNHLRSHPSSRAYLIALFACTYSLKQSFSIPGSAVLNVMAGFVFGVGFGVPLVALLTAAGASGCYFLSGLVGSELIGLSKSLASRVDHLRSLVDREKRRGAGELFLFMLILRVFPFTPNFFVNLASPLVGVPFATFFWSCAIGLIPYAYITVAAGETLQRLSSAAGGSADGSQSMQLSDILDGATLLKLALLALALLLPVILKRKLSKGGEDKENQFKL